MKNISSIFVAALLSGSCGLVAQTDAVPNELFGKVKIALAEGINSPDLDFSPIYFKNGIIFTSDRLRFGDKGSGNPNKQFNDLFFSEQMGDVSFKAPERIKALNSKFHDGIASFSEKDEKLYFTRNNQKGTILNTKKAKRLKIYVSSYVNDAWTEPQAVSFNVEKYSTCHPSVSADGQTMYFASNRPGGLGGMDIYVTHLENGKWSEPVNMGPDINTDKNEIFPFSDGNGTLFFSSEGHNNMGGLDLFAAQEVVNPHMTGDDNWEVSNLGTPFNSPADDFGFIGNAGGDKGFFTSGREGGNGRDDIYGWKTIEETPVEPVLASKRVKVIDAVTGLELPMTEVVLSEANRPGSINRYTTAKDGMVRFDWNKTSNYVVATEKNGYEKYDKVFQAAEMSDDVIVIRLNPVADIADATRVNKKPTKVIAKVDPTTKVEAYEEDIDNFIAKGEKTENTSLETGQLIELNHIYYAFDKYELKESAKVELDKVVTLLRQYPEMEIDLNSHTDSRGSDSYNQWLSTERAKSAVDYIVSQGIERRRVTAKGYGESVPVNECLNTMKCSEDKHQMNRRTEFRILNLGEKSILKSDTSKPKKMTFQGGGTPPGDLPVIQSVYYPSSQTDLSTNDKDNLRSIVEMMKKNDGMTVQVASFTDAVGNADFNQKLSERRAQRVANYMSSQGIRAKRIAVVGYGENYSTDMDSKNRRTDILVTNPGGVDMSALLEK